MNFLKNNFIKFIIIGIISTILNYLIFFIVYKIGVMYLIASSIGYISGLILGYFLNKNYNFYLKQYNNTFIKYILVYLTNLIVSLLILKLLVENFSINVYSSNFLILIYSTVANYLGIKYFAFKNKALLSIGIAGNSGSGKTILTNLLTEIIGDKTVSLLNGDSSHNWDRNNDNWNNITHLNPKANNLKKDLKDIKDIIRGLSITRKYYNHEVGKYTKVNNITSNPFIIYEGLHGLYKNIGKQFNIKIFVESDFCVNNKISRDIEKRNRDRKKLLDNIKKRENDYIEYILPQKNNSNININYIQKNSAQYLIIEIKDGIDNKLYELLNTINGVIINGKTIEIKQNNNYNFSDNILEKHGLNFIKKINPDILINNSYKGVFKLILISLLQKKMTNK